MTVKDPLPGTQDYVDLMGELAKAIAYDASQGLWPTVELKAAQLLKMCELRRQRLQSIG